MIYIIPIFICVIFILSIMFFIWANSTYKPTILATISMLSDNLVTITKDKFIVFTPNNITPSNGFIFYPGAKIKPEAYAPLCRKICMDGFLVAIAPMTLNLAIFSPNKAKDIINRFDNINAWAIGGHSLGGAMASNYALKDSKINSVVFYASYPAKNEFKDYNKDVLSIYGDLDGVAKLENIKGPNLPENSTFIEIKGGNHAQFGSYGEQSGDNKATISDEKQINLSSKCTINFLNNINKPIEMQYKLS